MSGRLMLHGGWGHDNLGDEAILAAYLSHFAGSDVVVSSPDPTMTRNAQRQGLLVVPEGRRADGIGPNVLAGGGYLNGAWRQEIPAKLRRLLRGTANGPLVIHAVEVRNWSTRERSSADHIVRLLSGQEVSVRDRESQEEMARLGLEVPAIVPDSIAMLFESIESYIVPVPELRGRVILNFLDIASRGDSHESSIAVEDYDRLTQALVEKLGSRALGLVVGAGDRKYISRFKSLEFVVPKTVKGLVSVLGASAAVVSVRMHPALLASMLGKPTFAIPYCGKVAPTLTNIGIEHQILASSDPDYVMDTLAHDNPTTAAAWSSAARRTGGWLDATLETYI